MHAFLISLQMFHQCFKSPVNSNDDYAFIYFFLTLGKGKPHRGRSVSSSLLSRKFNRHLVAGAANKGQESKQLFFLL